MGPVNWLAVVLAAVVALVLGLVWHGWLFRPRKRLLANPSSQSGSGRLASVIVMLLASIMFGHAFARIGETVLAVKPWLYFMQTGGIALAFVIPTLWWTHSRLGTEPGRKVLDCLFWLIAYLAMGAVFWAVPLI